MYDETTYRTIAVNLRKKTSSFPRSGRRGFQPRRVLDPTLHAPKALLSPGGFICLGVSSASV